MKEALEIALEYVLRTTHWTEGRDRHDTLKAIKEALAQPAHEPDTYRSVPHGHCTHPRCKEVFSAYIEANKRLAHYEPEGKSPMILNAAPPQRLWVGLTDDEDWEHIHNMRGTSLDNFSQGAVWAEARLKEHNNG